MGQTFRFGTGKASEAGAPSGPFRVFGLPENPFPASGVTSGVLYQGHLRRQLGEIDAWMAEVERAAATSGGALRPLALRGSLGVGKTHLLRALEQGIIAGGVPVMRRILTGQGMTRLLLSNLLLGGFNPAPVTGDAETETASGPAAWIHVILARSRGKTRRARLVEALQELALDSPVRIGFQALLAAEREDRPELAGILGRWLGRSYTTPAQRGKLGLPGTLDSEGAAILAVTDLARLTRAVGGLKIFYVLLDQLEELFRPGVITAGRRARFLTDLRTLVDQAFEGAPVAVLLAWNTDVDPSDPTARDPQADAIRYSYRALWERLGQPLDLPSLRVKDVWPFAEAWLSHAYREHALPDAKNLEERRARLERLLERTGQARVLRRLERETATLMTPEPDRWSAREVLAAWRAVAEELASGPRHEDDE